METRNSYWLFFPTCSVQLQVHPWCLPFLLWCQPGKHRNPPLNSLVMIIAPAHILEKQKFVISSWLAGFARTEEFIFTLENSLYVGTHWFKLNFYMYIYIRFISFLEVSRRVIQGLVFKEVENRTEMGKPLLFCPPDFEAAVVWW